MSEEFNEDLPKVDELTALKSRADLMGLTYHPSIKEEALREKIKAALEDAAEKQEEQEDQDQDQENPSQEETKEKEVVKPVKETEAQRRVRLRNEALRMVRVRVTCMNPAKREWEGEIFTVGNSLIGSHKKFVPFNADDGWHIPYIMYKMIKQRKCQVFYSVKMKNGQTARKGKLISEFAIELLPDLTEKELKELARRQAMARSID